LKILSPSVLVRETGTTKGRGVFATRSYAQGETVEACPTVLFTGFFSQIPAEVRKLLYHWSFGSDGGNNVHCLALGYGSLYNHDNPANMRYEALTEAKVLRFVAVRAIEEGEELTTNYNAVPGEHRSDGNAWFDVMGVTPLPEAENATNDHSQ